MGKLRCCTTPNKKGFTFDLLLALVLVGMAALTIATPWRVISFSGGFELCTQYSLRVFDGMCEGKSSGSCIAWNDAPTWFSFDTLNAELNDQTSLQKSASTVWPVVGGLVGAGFSSLALMLIALIMGLEECASSTVAQTTAGFFSLTGTMMYLIAIVLTYRTDQLVTSAYQFCLADTILAESSFGGVGLVVIVGVGAIATFLILFPGMCGKCKSCIEEEEEDEEEEAVKMVNPNKVVNVPEEPVSESKAAPVDV